MAGDFEKPYSVDKADRPSDPAEAMQPGPVVNRRAGYGKTLERAERWARKGGTLMAGEGLALVEELDRLRLVERALDSDLARVGEALLVALEDVTKARAERADLEDTLRHTCVIYHHRRDGSRKEVEDLDELRAIVREEHATEDAS